MFLSKNFIVTGLTFRPLIHFELIFIYGISEMAVTQLCPTLRPHGLYSPWNSLGQNAGVGGLSFLQGSSQPKDQTQVSRIADRFFTI